MGKLMSAMDIPEPKLVINLIGALDLNGASKAAELTVAPYSCSHAERNARDLLESDRRLCAFFEEHVLPVAVQTQALVLLHVDCCHMAWAFDRLCIDYAKTMASGKLPFTVLHFCAATHVLYDL
jgi:hypothetical protein